MNSEFQLELGKIYPNFCSWNLPPTNLGRCSHAMSARSMPIAQLKQIIKWARIFKSFKRHFRLDNND